MSRCQPKDRPRYRSDALLALLVATAAASLAQTVPLAAQEAGLRGEVAENVLQAQASDGLTTGAISTASPDPAQPDDTLSTTGAPAYEPISPGAVPDQPDTASDTSADPLSDGSTDGFADTPVSATPVPTAASRQADDTAGTATTPTPPVPPADDAATSDVESQSFLHHDSLDRRTGEGLGCKHRL